MGTAVPSDSEFSARIRDAVKNLNSLTMQAANAGVQVRYRTTDYRVISTPPGGSSEVLEVEVVKVL